MKKKRLDSAIRVRSASLSFYLVGKFTDHPMNSRYISVSWLYVNLQKWTLQKSRLPIERAETEKGIGRREGSPFGGQNRTDSPN